MKDELQILSDSLRSVGASVLTSGPSGAEVLDGNEGDESNLCLEGCG